MCVIKADVMIVESKKKSKQLENTIVDCNYFLTMNRPQKFLIVTARAAAEM